MSLTYGYDLRDGDKILEAPIQAIELLSPLALPGGCLLNHLPFCAITRIVSSVLLASHGDFQCGTFLHGYHTSVTSHSREYSGS